MGLSVQKLSSLLQICILLRICCHLFCLKRHITTAPCLGCGLETQAASGKGWVGNFRGIKWIWGSRRGGENGKGEREREGETESMKKQA